MEGAKLSSSFLKSACVAQSYKNTFTFIVYKCHSGKWKWKWKKSLNVHEPHFK